MESQFLRNCLWLLTLAKMSEIIVSFWLYRIGHPAHKWCNCQFLSCLFGWNIWTVSGYEVIDMLLLLRDQVYFTEYSLKVVKDWNVLALGYVSEYQIHRCCPEMLQWNISMIHNTWTEYSCCSQHIRRVIETWHLYHW